MRLAALGDCKAWAAKKAARRRLFRIGEKPDYLLAAIEAAAATAVAAAFAAAVAAADAALSTVTTADEAVLDIDVAGAAAGVVTMTAGSSFLPQAVKAAAAIRVANSSDLFICVLSEKC